MRIIVSYKAIKHNGDTLVYERVKQKSKTDIERDKKKTQKHFIKTN